MTPLTEERTELRAAVRRCLDRSEGPRPYLAGEPGVTEPYDAKLWRVLAAEVGVAGLLVPEAHGGSGAMVADLAVVAEELGGALAPVPFLSTVGFATTALLLHPGDALAGELLARIADGGTVVTLASGAGDGGDVATAEEVDGEWRLSGRIPLVVDAAAADVVLVAARTGTGVGLFAVDPAADGARADASTALDLTRRLGVVTLDAAPGRLVGTATGAERRLRIALDLALVLLAVEHVGGAQRCLDDAVAYAKQRVQFGRPIGGFQAIKHTLVDVLLKVEMARAAAGAAVRAADAYLAAPGDATAHGLALAASLAKAVSSDAFMHTAEETLHVYGGIGFTWEHDAHLHYRRAKSAQLFLGTADRHRERLATCAGL